MRVLIACEFSGIVRDAFAALGHDAWSCDIRETEIPGQHIQGDVLDYLNDDWDLLIAHPPCKYLANSGGRWLYKDGKRWPNGKDRPENPRDTNRWKGMIYGAVFFNKLWKSGIPRICVENPIQHEHARKLIDIYTQTINSWQFGHAETKATCLWLKGLPQLMPTDVIPPDYEKYPPGKGNGFEPRVHYESPGKGDEREKNRSRTMTGIAAAMAAQWSNLVQEQTKEAN